MIFFLQTSNLEYCFESLLRKHVHGSRVVHFIVLAPNSLSQVAQELHIGGLHPYPIRYPSPKKLVGEGLASPFLFSSVTLPTYTCI